MQELLQQSQATLKIVRYLLEEAGVKDLGNFCTYEQGCLKNALEKVNAQILINAGVEQL